jgi:hypothetical protein
LRRQTISQKKGGGVSIGIVNNLKKEQIKNPEPPPKGGS